MNPLSLLPWWVQALIVAAAIAAAVAALAAYNHHQREIGRDEIRAEWNEAKLAQTAADLAAEQAKAKESQRRLSRQQENQDAQNQELARVAADRDRAGALVVKLQRTNDTASQQWAARLADSPTRADLAAAGTTIGVLTELLGRARERARVVEAFTDTSRAAGLKCERDYDALAQVTP